MDRLLPEIWPIIFRFISPYNRSLICTVSKQWLVFIVKLADDLSHLPIRDLLINGAYHTVVRIVYWRGPQVLSQLDKGLLRILQRVPNLKQAIEHCHDVCLNSNRSHPSYDYLRTMQPHNKFDYNKDSRLLDNRSLIKMVICAKFTRDTPHINDYYRRALHAACLNNNVVEYYHYKIKYGLNDCIKLDWESLLSACNEMTSPFIIQHIKSMIELAKA